MVQALVIGCGLSGAVIARELAEKGIKVRIIERRSHIGGNMYDHVDDKGILVHNYGPHTFHTQKENLFEYICKFADWDEYYLTCGAEINGICTPTPFNFQTIDDFFSVEEANKIKCEIEKTFPGRNAVTVVEALRCGNKTIEDYAQFLFDNDYSLYSAKQWGLSPNEIDSSILKRVPLRFNYEKNYFLDKYQVMPHISYTNFFENLLNHENISIELNVEALDYLKIKEEKIYFNKELISYPVIYTGPLDELFTLKYGELPYRSLRFEWRYEDKESIQEMPVVAYPQASDFIRIIEYKKLPVQHVKGTTYEIEYSCPYKYGQKNEPYYPVLTTDSQKKYEKYKALANKIDNLFVCGRLGNFKYYNMDQALEAALDIASKIAASR